MNVRLASGKNKLFAVLFAAFVLFDSSYSYASDPAWYGKQYGYYSEGEELSAALEDFASAVGVPIRISPNVKAKFSGSYTSVTAKEFLDAISRVYNLIWYYDGNILYVYQSRETVTELITLKNIDADEVSGALRQLNIWDERFGWKSKPDQKIVFVSGPPRYTELVKWVIEGLDRSASMNDLYSYEMKVFQLSHARIYDRVIVSRGQEVVIPGVVSILKRLIGAHSQSATLGAGGPTSLQDTVSSFKESLGGSEERSKSKSLAHVPVTEMSTYIMGEGKLNGSSKNPSDPNVIHVGGRAYIEGDPRTNSLIVYDIKSRMPYYEKIIEQLDTRSEQIEIEVSIIDIRTDKLKEAGIDWEWRNNGRTVGHGSFNDDSYGGFTPQSNTTSFLNSATQSFTTVLGSNTDYFLTRVRLLAGKGDAQVLAQPAVLTQNNMVAVLDNSQTFFVKLEGQEEVDLKEITVGTLLQVKPHLFAENGVKKIRLDISIEDGNQTGDLVDQLPVIKNTTIDTEAVVAEGTSLLVGGYYFDQRQKSVSKVPFLGDVPVLGYMFKKEKNEIYKTTRMFMITPKLVTQDSASETDPTKVAQYELKANMDKEKQNFSKSSHFEIMD